MGSRIADEFFKYAFLGRVSLGIYVDNCFAIGNSISGAIAILEKCEQFLQLRWNLQMKDASLEVMPVWGYGEFEDYNDRWRLVTSSKVLGHTLLHNGSTNGCFQATLASAWKQFWSNVGRPVFRKFSVKLKLRRLSLLVFPIVEFRLARWPFSMSKARQLDSAQRKMVGILLGLRKQLNHVGETFWQQKSAAISKHIGVENKWSNIWATGVVSWSEHIARNSYDACWCAKLSEFLPPDELSQRRSQNSGRHCVRASNGFASTRWFESVENAKTWLVCNT